MLKRLLAFSLVLAAILTGTKIMAQGVTTGAISGVVTDDRNGEPLPGATVVATHTPSGTQYAQVTRPDGRFTFPAVRVGGPYTIKITYVGYREQAVENVTVELGQTRVANIRLTDASTQLTEVVITGAQDPVLNSERTGASSNFRREQIERLPSISRSFQDISQLTPQAGPGFSFGGRSSLYNNFSIDGSTSNNVFGLSALPGGQSSAQPISLDAIQEINVSVAPYDVRQGAFTGAGVNAVTRSGTNEFQGSLYYFFRNNSFSNSKVGDVERPLGNFNFYNVGGRLGGPIIKNKLFFFVNYEEEKRTEPAVTVPISAAKKDELEPVRQRLINTYNYDPGTLDNFDLPTFSRKILARLDWNISQNHKLTVRYNRLNSYRDIPPSNSGGSGYNPQGRQNGVGSNAHPFSGIYYRINNNLDSYIAELNSSFGSRFANTLTIGYNRFRDSRQRAGGGNWSPFPTVDILGPDGQNYTSFGSEPFSPNNILNQDVIQFNDNFNWYLTNHTLSFGTANEYYQFFNSFTPQIYGSYLFNNVGDFLSGTPNSYFLQYSANPETDPAPAASWRALSLGLYAQDEYTGIKNLKLTVGLRADVPIYLTNPADNPISDAITFNDGQQYKVGELPQTTVLFSPRVGFNWDVKGDRTTQVRGGTGLFTGRIPFVWISNQLSNNGVLFGQADIRNNTAAINNPETGPRYPFRAEPYRPILGAAATGFSINVTKRDFKFPQTWRSNLAVDQQLPWGLVGTLEFIYSRFFNDVFVRNVNLANPIGTVPGDGRPLWGAVNGNTSVNAPQDRRFNDVVNQALVLDNTNKGYQWSITAQLQKTFIRTKSTELTASAAYTYSDAREINPQSSSIANSVWTSNSVVRSLNDPEVSYAANLFPHRVIANVSYRREYLGFMASSLSLIYEGRNGFPFSYVSGGDMNSDGVNGTELIYIPRNQNEIVLVPTDANDRRTTDQLWNELNAYIEQDKYLSERRGQYAQRNAARAPWVNSLNLSFLQDFYITAGGKRNTLQFSATVENFLNLLNTKWGLVQSPNRTQLLNFVGYTSPHNTATNPNPTTGRPVYTFAPVANTFLNNPGVVSRWQIQLGLRYIFN